MFTKFIEEFLSKEECDYLIKLGESKNLIDMKSSKFLNEKMINQNLEYVGNKRKGCYFINETLEDEFIISLTNKIITISNNTTPFKSIKYENVLKYSFNKYSNGDFLNWHEDKHEIMGGATITIILQLNDNYEGGYVKYLIDGVENTLPKKRGSIFLFDSNISHFVDVIELGNRYSINAWPTSIKSKTLI